MEIMIVRVMETMPLETTAPETTALALALAPATRSNTCVGCTSTLTMALSFKIVD